MAEGAAGKSKTAQKSKIYKAQAKSTRGGPRGRGGRGGGKGGRGGSNRPESSRQGEDGEKEVKIYPMDKYRIRPLPEVMSAPGICVTTVKGKEREAEREIVEYLEEVADELYPETADVKVKDEEEDLDIEEMLKRELQGMAEQPKSSRFHPVALVKRLVAKVKEEKKCTFRNVQRLTPISAACGATLLQLGTIAKDVVAIGFKTEDNRALKFAINTNSRNSDKLQRLDMIKTVAEQIEELGAGHKVDLKDPERTILIELHRNIVGLSVVENFEQYKKFNPRAIADAAYKASLPATSADSSLPSAVSSDSTHSKHENRSRVAAHMTPSANLESLKRKVPNGEGEDGEISKTEDVEEGEMVEGEKDLKNELEGEDFVQVVDDGKVLKMRRVDAE